MNRSTRPLRRYGLLAPTILLLASAAHADDMVSFATGGYAAGLRTVQMMHVMDTNKDGMVSKAEWDAFQEKVFDMLDPAKTGFVDAKTFMGGDHPRISFATGGYARGLRTDEMFNRIDVNHDGRISRAEFLDYQSHVFEMMDTGKKGMLGPTDFIRKGT